ncbi:MAG: hypothetical protein ACP5FX_02820 [Candidatus Micrarchaeia archaeon]
MSFEKEVGEKGEGKKKEVRFPQLLKEEKSSKEFEIKEIREEKEEEGVIEKIKKTLKKHRTLSILSLFISEFALIQTTTNILLSITPPGVVGAIVTEAFVISEAIALALLNIPIIDDLLQPEPS